MSTATELSDLEFSLVFTAIITIVYQLFFFFIAAYYKFDKVTDLAGGSNFVIIAIIIFAIFNSPDPNPRPLANTILVLAWGVRLSAFLLYRVLLFENDGRFDEIRDNFCKFLAFWVFQMVWVWIVSLPLTYVNSLGRDVRHDLNAGDIIGFLMACSGLIIETIADQSKLNFKLNPSNKGKWCVDGIWKYSRHPNYFGELIFWWGIFISCSQSFYNVHNFGYFTLLSPLFIMSLLFGLSGMPILEKNTNIRYKDSAGYLKYRQETSVLIPLPNSVYNAMPYIIKRLLFFEWPVYAIGLNGHEETPASSGNAKGNGNSSNSKAHNYGSSGLTEELNNEGQRDAEGTQTPGGKV